MQGHKVALDKLPSKVAAVVPRDQLEHAVSAAGLPAKGARFVTLAQLAALEALQVSDHCPFLTAVMCPACSHSISCSQSGIPYCLVQYVTRPCYNMHHMTVICSGPMALPLSEG